MVQDSKKMTTRDKKTLERINQLEAELKMLKRLTCYMKPDCKIEWLEADNEKLREVNRKQNIELVGLLNRLKSLNKNP